MKWKNIKTLFIILFAAVTVYLSVIIGVRYREMSYVDEQVARDAIELLAAYGITVNEETIPKKLIKYDVVEGEFSSDYFQNGVGISLKSDDFTSYATPSGSIKYINNSNGSTFEHFSPFDLVYKKVADSIGGVEYKYEIDGDDVQVENEKIENRIKNELISLFGSDAVSRDDNNGFSVKVKSVYHEKILDIYKANLIQTLDGCVIYGNEIYVEMDSSGLNYLSGTMILNKSYSSYTADLYDQVNILFIERQHLVSNTEQDQNSEAVKLDKTVSSMETVYCVSWSYDRSKYYLIPSWKIVYSDGTESIINAVNGKVYVD